MDRVGELTTGEINRLISPIVELADKNLMRLSEPSFEFVPEQMRGGITTIHRRLKAELEALLKLVTVYGDLGICRVVASNYPWQNDELSPYQHLRLAWLQLVQLSSMFDHSMTEVDRLHSETLELLSIDVARAVFRGTPRAGGGDRSMRVDRWFAVAPQHEAPTLETLRMASEWSSDAALFASHCSAVRDELLEQIDATVQIVGTSICRFLLDHAAELMDLIGRYNNMLENLHVRHSRP
ncbi:hypothetical protein [Bradyrhizobium yuanmingense]|uniref:hypothetical protein n=1 Tax=Bradyrhizobium yuanmingense TaxID=108015 RepID=UPI0023B9B886|nr:hypothetical protein [Bradyrhizobium yuanmingense]MDF0578244.1 hypothetical protein [Bradyrhizobium yuanmingense]